MKANRLLLCAVLLTNVPVTQAASYMKIVGNPKGTLFTVVSVSLVVSMAIAASAMSVPEALPAEEKADAQQNSAKLPSVFGLLNQSKVDDADSFVSKTKDEALAAGQAVVGQAKAAMDAKQADVTGTQAVVTQKTAERDKLNTDITAAEQAITDAEGTDAHKELVASRLALVALRDAVVVELTTANHALSALSGQLTRAQTTHTEHVSNLVTCNAALEADFTAMTTADGNEPKFYDTTLDIESNPVSDEVRRVLMGARDKSSIAKEFRQARKTCIGAMRSLSVLGR